MRVRFGARSDIGRARERNEDSYLARRPLFAVADGMGGHRGGDVASSLAVEVLEGHATREAAMQGLVEEIKQANKLVLQRGGGDRNLRGMGTTVTALLAEDEKAYLAHVGDSRAYLLRDGAIQQLTEDHTLVQRMVNEGKLSREEAGHHPQRSILTRALGVEDEVPVDELTLPIHAGDRVLLCTDGLSSMVSQERIQEILHDEQDPQVACDRLVEEANQAGGDDNITVIVLDFLEGEESAEADTMVTPPPRPEPSKEAPPKETPAEEPLTATVPAVAVEKQPLEPPAEFTNGEAPPKRIRWWRVALWAFLAIALLAGAYVGARAYVYSQWYVGEAGGVVAIYNGIPTEVPGMKARVEQTTDIPADEAMKLQPWRGLGDGITADSLEDARDIVRQIRSDLEASAPAGGP